MSRMYVVQLPMHILIAAAEAENLDKLRMEFPVLEVLPVDEMEAAIRERLLNLGWQEGDEHELVHDGPNKTRWKIDPHSRQLTVDAPDFLNEKIGVSLVDPDVVPTDTVTAIAELGLNLGDAHRVELGRAKAGLQNRLVTSAIKARKELNNALKEVYQTALKQKAQQLGNIRSISESSENGRTRIRIEVS